MDGAPACPFVAFGDDRDSRATSPDHRHRCFAETPPAPRALAHQEAYCLSSAFPVCPTFQDWARREAAQARADEMRADTSLAAAAAGADSAPGADDDDVAYPPPSRPPEPPPARNPPRDWAAPPPWATGAGATTRAGSSGPTADELLAGKAIEGQGLAGSAADQLAGGAPPAAAAAAWSASGAGAASTPADHELAGLVASDPAASASPATPPNATPSTSSAPRAAASSTRPASPSVPGPSWERPRRYEAYPAIKTRASLPGIPRLGVLAGAVAIAALALFMLPALLGIGGGGPNASPSPSTPIATATPVPTTPPAPTPQLYVIKQGDTLSKVAKRFGVTLDDLLAANKDTIKNPDKIAVGDEIIIPVPASEEEPSAPAGSAAASVAP
jgi:nucleoid-associated protein YgaU